MRVAHPWSEAPEQLRAGLAAIVAEHRLGDPDSVHLVHTGFRLTGRFESSGGSKSLCLTRLRSRAELELGVDYHRHVFEAGAPVSRPLPLIGGDFVVELDFLGRRALAVLSEWVPGVAIGVGRPDAATYRAWGRAVASLHAASTDYRIAPASPILTWEREWQTTRERLRDAAPEIGAEVSRVDAWLVDRTTTPERIGVTHGDMNAGNAIHSGRGGSSVTLIDFEEPIVHFWSADLARPLRELDEASSAERRRIRDALVDGYDAIRPLSDREVASLPWWVRFKNLSIYAWTRAQVVPTPEEQSMRTLANRIASPWVGPD